MKVRVRKGDTLWHYSQFFAIPLQLIIDSNQNVGANLDIGQEIHIPGYRIDSHKIKSGDTFWKIAQLYNLPLDAISLLNQDKNANNLNIDDTIHIPVRVTNRIVQGKRAYDYNSMKNDLQKLQEIYPFMIYNSIGKSVLNHDIPEIIIGNGSKRVHVNGSFHANEWITTTIIMTFLNDYLLSLTNSNSIQGLSIFPFYQHSLLSIVPMVNPDGVNLVLNGPPEDEQYKTRVVEINNGSLDFSNWKANIRGVDLNNQFPAKWEIEKERKEPKSPAPRDFPGHAPLTEPEVVAIANLTRRMEYWRVLAFHTQGEEIYWGYEGKEPPESEAIVNEFARVSGYKAVRYIDSHAGYKDWFIQEWERPGFTIELGEGVNPLPIEQFDEIYEESLGIFLASLYM